MLAGETKRLSDLFQQELPNLNDTRFTYLQKMEKKEKPKLSAKRYSAVAQKRDASQRGHRGKQCQKKKTQRRNLM